MAPFLFNACLVCIVMGLNGDILFAKIAPNLALVAIGQFYRFHIHLVIGSFLIAHILSRASDTEAVGSFLG